MGTETRIEIPDGERGYNREWDSNDPTQVMTSVVLWHPDSAGVFGWSPVVVHSSVDAKATTVYEEFWTDWTQDRRVIDKARRMLHATQPFEKMVIPPGLPMSQITV